MMMTSPEQWSGYICLANDIVMSLIRMAGTAIEEGRSEKVESIGMPVTVLKKLASLDMTEQTNLLRLTRQISLPINWDSLETLISFAKDHSRKTRVLNTLVQARAPWPLLHDLFGISELEFARRRRLFGLARSSGRPTAPSEAQEREIWDLWNATKKEDISERLLIIQQRTGIPLSTVCLTIKQEINQLIGTNDHG